MAHSEKYCLKNGQCCFATDLTGMFLVVHCIKFGINDVRPVNPNDPCPYPDKPKVKEVEEIEEVQQMLF